MDNRDVEPRCCCCFATVAVDGLLHRLGMRRIRILSETTLFRLALASPPCEGYTSPQGPSSSPPPPPAAAADGTASSSSSSSASLSSEAQVVAWGSSLLRWLTGQFSAVLRRAERCRTELRGSTPAAATEASPAASFARTTTAAGTGLAVDAQGLNATAATSFPVDVSPSRAAGNGGGRRSTAGGGSGLDGALVSASPERSSALVSTGGDGGGGGHGQAAPAEQHGHAHGAAPAAVAVSARDIVVKSALAMVKESAASEVLGMWEPARKGYEKVRVVGDLCKDRCFRDDHVFFVESVCLLGCETLRRTFRCSSASCLGLLEKPRRQYRPCSPLGILQCVSLSGLLGLGVPRVIVSCVVADRTVYRVEQRRQLVASLVRL